MALSKEYTYWHLTPNGWVSGDSQTDFNKWSRERPKDTVLTVLYKENWRSAYSPLEETTSRIYEIPDKKKIEDLEKKFPFTGFIKVYEK